MAKEKGKVNVRRYRRITRFFAGVMLHLVVHDLVLVRLMPGRVRRTRPERLRGKAKAFRELAVELGGVMIKAGQFLSSRVDVLPPEITDELSGLQDEVPAEPYESIREILADELGRSPDEVFESIDEQPQAAASLGQTHRARIPEDGGRSVIVKVQRPGIEELVATDLAALRSVAHWLMLYGPLRKRVDVPALVAEFSRTTWDELDYVAEAENAARFAAMFEDDPQVMIPAAHPDYSTAKVLTLDDVEHIKITDLAAIDAAGINRAEVARKLFDVYMRQVFEEGFFHADPHPGNLFVRPIEGDGEQALRKRGGVGGGRPFQIIFVDFGMVGRVPPEMAEQLREVLVALALRDARRIVVAYQRLGLLLPGADLGAVEAATASVLDRFWGMSVSEISSVDQAEVRALATEFRDLVFELPFQVPQDFVFLGRAVGILSGLATKLDPAFEPWSAIEAHAQRLLDTKRRWPTLQQGLAVVRAALQPMLALPSRLDRVLLQAATGELEVRVSPTTTLEGELERLAWAAERLFWGMLFAALLVAGTWMYQADLRIIGTVMWAGSMLALVRALLVGRRH